MHIFDYSFLKNEIPSNYLNICNIIYDLKAKGILRQNENPRAYEDLKRSAIVDSIESSNAIEGIITTRDRIEGIVDAECGPVTHDEQEILGYKKVLEEIYQNYNDMDFDESLVKHFHQVMLQAVSDDAGEYKKDNNWIQERDENGKRVVRFVPVKAKDTPDAMQQLFMAYYEAHQDSDINKLLLIFCFLVDLLCIHGFRDGNGRLSRLVTSLLLLKEDFDIGRYISIEKKINEYKYGYYDALKKSSEGWHDNKNSYIPFMTYMLQILYYCYKEMDEKFIVNEVGKLKKSERIELAMKNTFVPISKEEICSRFPDISITTVERVLGKLLKEDKIVKIGTYRDARYKRKG